MGIINGQAALARLGRMVIRNWQETEGGGVESEDICAFLEKSGVAIKGTYDPERDSGNIFGEEYLEEGDAIYRLTPEVRHILDTHKDG